MRTGFCASETDSRGERHDCARRAGDAAGAAVLGLLFTFGVVVPLVPMLSVCCSCPRSTLLRTSVATLSISFAVLPAQSLA